MRCEEFETRLNQVLDDRRPLSSAGDIQTHARECGDCRELARGYEALLSGLARQVAPPTPSLLTARVLDELAAAGLERQRARLLRFPQRAAVLSLAAASLLLALGLAWMYHSRRLVLDAPGRVGGQESIAQARQPSRSKWQTARTAERQAAEFAMERIDRQEKPSAEQNVQASPDTDWAPPGVEWAQDVADGLQPVTEPTVGAINGFLNLWGLGQQEHRS